MGRAESSRASVRTWRRNSSPSSKTSTAYLEAFQGRGIRPPPFPSPIPSLRHDRCAMTVDARTAEAGVTVRRATSGATDSDRKPTRRTSGGSRHTSAATTRSGASGSTAGENESAGASQTSKPSGPPSTPSMRQWRRPKDAAAFAAQANRVATMILNGEIDLDMARTYSGVARTMAQVLSAEVYRARFLQQAPDLSLDDDDE
jgi:hypothetical protein